MSRHESKQYGDIVISPYSKQYGDIVISPYSSSSFVVYSEPLTNNATKPYAKQLRELRGSYNPNLNPDIVGIKGVSKFSGWIFSNNMRDKVEEFFENGPTKDVTPPDEEGSKQALIVIDDYTDGKIVLYALPLSSNITRDYREELVKMEGRYNYNLNPVKAGIHPSEVGKSGKFGGWIFDKSRRAEVEHFFMNLPNRIVN